MRVFWKVCFTKGEEETTKHPDESFGWLNGMRSTAFGSETSMMARGMYRTARCLPFTLKQIPWKTVEKSEPLGTWGKTSRLRWHVKSERNCCLLLKAVAELPVILISIRLIPQYWREWKKNLSSIVISIPDAMPYASCNGYNINRKTLSV